MRKALRRIAHLERLDSTAAEGAISAVLETSHGDMRHAVNSLQFMTTGVQHTAVAAAARGKQGRKRRRRSSRDAGDGARVSNQAATSRLRALVASCGHDRFRNPMHSIGKLLTGKRTLVWRAVRATPWCLWVTSACGWGCVQAEMGNWTTSPRTLLMTAHWVLVAACHLLR